MKLTEIDKLKYWIDTEFTILHVMFGIIMLQLTKGTLPTVVFSVYIGISLVYMITRATYLASIDRNYLKVPKQK